jgi:hypothetical protein
MQKVTFKGKYRLEHIRAGKVIGVYDLDNAVTDVGLNAILDIMFHSATQITAWYIGLIDNASYTALALADTMASHAGWIEFTDYSETYRQTWGAGAASSRSITDATAAEFSITDTGTLKGLFLCSEHTISGTTGTLWATAAFASNIVVANGDTARITYTING